MHFGIGQGVEIALELSVLTQNCKFMLVNSLLRAFTFVNFHQSEPKIVKSQSLLSFVICLETSNFIFINDL